MLRHAFPLIRVAALGSVVFSATAAAQTPQPFPRPGEPAAERPAPPKPQPPTTAPKQPPRVQPLTSSADQNAPSEAILGAPVYPGAQFITSYDAGRGQRYYLFGATTDFAQIVAYYKSVLKQKGELVYEEPPVHMFDTGRFREETMAFPPSVTVKDYTWGGAQGYLNPKRGAEPQRFRSIIQIVPPPAPQRP